MKETRYTADVSLALINRTGAYHICHDIVGQLPHHFVAKRYWRLTLEREPRGLLRKVLGRTMLAELDHLELARFWFGPRQRVADSNTLFFDPLYVLQTRLDARDIVLCHDVGPVTHPEFYDPETTARYAEAFAAIKAEGPGVVFVSEAVRREFVRCFGDRFRFLGVIPLYVRRTLAHSSETKPPTVSTPFLLTVGALEVRKNHRRIIEAFVNSGLPERGYSYVFCGPRGNSARDVRSLAGATPAVSYLEYVSDAEVRWLYRHASGFVMPSLLEGFGLPALEAAQYGLVTIISRDSAQSEATGGGAIEVDPLSVSAISKGLLQLVEMPGDERKDRVATTRKHAAGLTQEKFLQEWSRLLASDHSSVLKVQ